MRYSLTLQIFDQHMLLIHDQRGYSHNYFALFHAEDNLTINATATFQILVAVPLQNCIDL